MAAIAATSSGPAPVKWFKACGMCRRTYATVEWNTLALVASLPSERVQPHLSVPAEWTVELRRCHCGAMLAARVA